MAHFAEIDENNIVTRVIVIHDSLEPMGAEWCHKTFGGNWVQTSYNGRIRKHYASIGFLYDKNLDIFIPPKPHDSWILDTNDYVWKSPVPYPTDEKFYIWNEQSLSWIEPPIL